MRLESFVFTFVGLVSYEQTFISLTRGAQSSPMCFHPFVFFLGGWLGNVSNVVGDTYISNLSRLVYYNQQDIPYLFTYKPSLAIRRDPKLVKQDSGQEITNKEQQVNQFYS